MAVEPSYPPLFGEGFKRIAVDAIEELFVERCPSLLRSRRASTLRLFIEKLRAIGVQGELWIDGSFATTNPTPADIDIVLFTTIITLKAMTPEQREELHQLSTREGRAYVRERWNCDFYVRDSNSLMDRQYWRDLFSNNPGWDEPKGIPVIRI